MKCRYCAKDSCIRKGKRGLRQRLQCRECGKYQQDAYVYTLYRRQDDQLLKTLNAECAGMLSMSRIMGYSHGTIQRRMLYLCSLITRPIYCENGQVYELDELRTYIGRNTPSNYCYIAYAINRSTSQVIDITFGNRSVENLGKVVRTLKAQNPRKIITDKLNVYPNLVKPYPHDTRVMLQMALLPI